MGSIWKHVHHGNLFLFIIFLQLFFVPLHRRWRLTTTLTNQKQGGTLNLEVYRMTLKILTLLGDFDLDLEVRYDLICLDLDSLSLWPCPLSLSLSLRSFSLLCSSSSSSESSSSLQAARSFLSAPCLAFSRASFSISFRLFLSIFSSSSLSHDGNALRFDSPFNSAKKKEKSIHAELRTMYTHHCLLNSNCGTYMYTLEGAGLHVRK